MNKKILSIALFILAVTAAPSQAQIMSSSGVASFRFIPGQEQYLPGESFQMIFEVEVKEGWHTQSNNPDMEGLIATKLSFNADNSITFGRVSYPKPTMEKFDFSDKPLPTFKGKFYLAVTGALAQQMAPGDYPAEALLTIQACSDSACIAPSELKTAIGFKVLAAGSQITKVNQDIYKQAIASLATGAEEGGGQGMGDVGGYLKSKGMALTLLLIFLGGLALNLTPCVYPLIPITVSFFGGSSESSKARLALKAAFYFLGMTVMYSLLGVVAALTGGMFGAMLQHWAVMILLAGAMVGLSLSMFGLYDIRVPDFLSQVGGANREGYIGSFLMGLTAGIIAAPCIGPFVLGLLTFVGEMGDPFLGFLLFFTLAAGLGAPYVVLAIFSGGISLLPRSGMWMVWVKKVFAFILLGMALYFLRPLIPKEAYIPIFAIFMGISGVYLAFFSQVAGAGWKFRMAQVTVGVLAVIGGGLLWASSASHAQGPHIQWQKGTQAALDKARADGAAAVIDFTADWCIPCKELEHYTFSDPKVIELSARLRPIQVDLTKSGDAEADELKKKFEVQGVPTVVFLDSSGAERQDLRFVGFVDADEFLGRMKGLLGLADGGN